LTWPSRLWNNRRVINTWYLRKRGERTHAAEMNCPLKAGCHRTFCTHDSWSVYVRTIASSSSKRLSKTFTTPSAKLARKVCDEPLSEEILVTGLSELVSKSYGKHKVRER
jgi:hypothetical protein